ncbi:hypothetical protein WN944_002535 [Citrus x changshan-huyou]|uniref:Uncharacterized protein n=1 Tax=Citrus x changshan-huyou TaxID=2935761 RepID=A0AAP0MLU7_9ROSI
MSLQGYFDSESGGKRLAYADHQTGASHQFSCNSDRNFATVIHSRASRGPTRVMRARSAAHGYSCDRIV